MIELKKKCDYCYKIFDFDDVREVYAYTDNLSIDEQNKNICIICLDKNTAKQKKLKMFLLEQLNQ